MIRAVRSEDLRFVYSAWVESYSTSEWAKSPFCVPYRDTQNRLVERLVRESVVLVDEATDGLIDGWICGWPSTTLHYVYVRQGSRGRGVARGLLEAMRLRAADPITFTHRARGIRGQPRAWKFDKASLLLRKESDDMAKRRIKFVKFRDGVSIPFLTPAGTRENKEYLREADKFVAEYDDEKRTVTVFTKELDREQGKLVEVEAVMGVESTQWMQLYPKGEIPKWEREEREKGAA